MTAITVYRRTTVDDAYGDPKAASWDTFGTFDGKVGWGSPDESEQPSRKTVTTTRGVYIRATQPTGIDPRDEVEIEGVRYEIDGAVAEWGDPHRGTHFSVKAVS